MDTMSFWHEEMRNFPHGSEGVALWVVRQEGSEAGSPLNIVYAWATGKARQEGTASRPPLSSFLKAMNRGQEELVHWKEEVALWIEPLISDSTAHGCIGVWFHGKGPWKEAIFMWAQRLAARLGPVLGQLENMPTMSPGKGLPWQPTLFPMPEPTSETKAINNLTHLPAPTKQWSVNSREVSLPLPVTIPGIPGCVGVSQEMKILGQRLASIASSGVNVLLNGESGTGKEIIAHALHTCSPRHQGPFVGQNCAALPEALFESELFGHKAGSFTGAQGDKKGLLAAASGGTFFLDEIGDMPLPLQIKLLRVMQERTIRRIGEIKGVPVDLRFVAATHKDLHQEIENGKFRLDLFYRLKVVNMVIPPLRQRPEDILPLFSFFLQKGNLNINRISLSERALQRLQTWRWPGNVRELENEALRFMALNPRVEHIKLEHLSLEVQTGDEGISHPADLGLLRNLDQANEILEQYLIRKAIAVANGQKSAAARQLGLSRQGLYKKITRYGMRDLISSRDLQP
ncbi:MAG: sigma-54-dependent Fis family transcriptional regulator [bacterium]|nr:sigma-54-dependent Fis family transcriptional regulator [bacterium]